MIQTRKSNPNKPYRIMIYGGEGVGKSTLGATAEKPVFISAEGGTDQLTDLNGNPIEEMPNVNSWDGVLLSIKDLAEKKHDFKTLVLDSADWLEGLAHKKIITGTGKTIITVLGGYGAGYRAAQNMFQELIENLSALREKKNMNIIFTAHSHVKAVKDPEMMHDYDAHEIKLHEYASSVLREWCDAVFFARFKTYTKESEDNSKARAFGDDSRVLYTVKRPAFQAKNRYGIPPELEFTLDIWNDLNPYISKGVKKADDYKPEDLVAEAEHLLTLVKDEKTKKAASEVLQKANGDQAKLIAIIKRLNTLTKTEGDSEHGT